uniref:Uncharacterized protein n=1 Tax=Nelumbo nucifera TaxID=4432 RepID=A0A822Z2P8_NELNU|nr:TPA_asm: hypothetical protein HUJ06_008356 [Nelumbo nucifera]
MHENHENRVNISEVIYVLVNITKTGFGCTLDLVEILSMTQPRKVERTPKADSIVVYDSIIGMDSHITWGWLVSQIPANKWISNSRPRSLLDLMVIYISGTLLDSLVLWNSCHTGIAAILQLGPRRCWDR